MLPKIWPDYEPVPDPAWSDEQVWAYATEHNLTIITKDVDYEVLVAGQAPPHVIRLCIGNMRRRDLWRFWSAPGQQLYRPVSCREFG